MEQIKSSVGLLVYEPDKKRNKDTSFDTYLNAGSKVIKETLERKGVEVEYISEDTAYRYPVVLVSFTSTYDIISFYKKVALRNDWQRGVRKFIVVGGGFGMQNPHVIRDFVDYAVFGRAEDFVYELVDTLLGGKDYFHESVMNLPIITPVKVGQASTLLDLDCFKEHFVGCVHKCKFCHYSWSRKSIGNQAGFVQGGDAAHETTRLTTGRASLEVMLKDIKNMKEKYGKTRAALDGFSERLRYLYGKRITDDDLLEAIHHLGEFDGITFLNLYNISNMPTETDEDRQQFFDVMKKADPRNRVVLVMNVTPFRPSLSTPLLFAPVNLFPNWHKFSTKMFENRPNFEGVYSFCESPWSHLQTVVVERATMETDKLFHIMCFSTKLSSARSTRKIKMLENNFDLSPYLREYDVEEEHYPGWFLNSYTPHSMLKQAYQWVKKRENMQWKNGKFV